MYGVEELALTPRLPKTSAADMPVRPERVLIEKRKNKYILG